MVKSKKTFFFVLSSSILLLIFIVGYQYRYKILYKYLGGKPAIVMVGSTRTLHGHWHLLLARPDVVNSGGLNFTTAQILSESSEKVLRYRPKVCFIEGGANDLIQNVEVKEIEKNIRLLVDTLKTISVLPIIELNIYSATDTNLNKRIDSLNAALIALSKQTGAEYIDLNPGLSENGFLQKKYAKEPLLLTTAAYPLWAAKVSQVLNKYTIN